jgi:hypothetical protein
MSPVLGLKNVDLDGKIPNHLEHDGNINGISVETFWNPSL